jgi:hypothetical protein
MKQVRRAARSVRARLALLGALGGLALPSCTALPAHTATPYDHDARRAAEIEAEAAQWCSARGQPAGSPSLPFRFDGCSWWPDGDYRDCCQAHDYAYWCGGSPAERATADERLRACVAQKRGGAYARLMWLGVRAGGHPSVPLYFRWGFGHPYAGGYPDAKLRAGPKP